MQNIFLSLDFSTHADHAALYAAELAKHSGARLILFHAYNPKILSDEDDVAEELEGSERWVQDKLDDIARKLKSQYDISITRLIKPGNLVEETLLISDKIKADMILLGITGIKIRQRLVLNNQAEQIVRKASLPVLLIPATATFTSAETVFLAAEENEIQLPFLRYRIVNKQTQLLLDENTHFTGVAAE